MSKSKTLFILLSLSIAAIDSFFVITNYFFAHETLQQSLNDKSKSDYTVFKTAEEATYNGLAIQATFFAGNSQIQNLFLYGKKALESEGGGAGGARTALLRNELYQLVAQPWENASQKFDMRHFHFHLHMSSQALSYLRVHQPDKFGDRLDKLRFLIVDADAEQAPKSGFETGRVSSGLRSAVPVFALDRTINKKVYVGVLELSTSFQKMLTTIEQNMQIHSSVLLNKQHIQQTVWDEFMDGLYKNNTINGCNCILEASSPPGQKKFLEHIDKKFDFNTQLHNADQLVRIVSYNNHSYAVTFHPFRDYLGIKNPERDNIGAIVMSRNIDTLLSSYNEKQLFNIIYGIITYLIIEFLLAFTFFKVTRYLSTQVTLQTRKLSEQKQRIKLDKQKYKHLAETINHNYFYYTRNAKNQFIFISPAIKPLLGFSPEEFIANSRRYLPKKTRTILASKNFYLEQRETSFAIEIFNKAGRYQYFLTIETTKFNNDKQVNEIEGLAQDISNSRQESMLLKLRCHILQLIADRQTNNSTLTNAGKLEIEGILTELAIGIEAIIKDIHCAIMLFDKESGCLLPAAAPSLSVELVDRLHKLEALDKESDKPENTVACLSAARTLKRKIITDLKLFDNSVNASELLKQESYKASCSEPVLSSTAKILATVDFYYKQTGKPDESDLQIIAVASNLLARLLEPNSRK